MQVSTGVLTRAAFLALAVVAAPLLTVKFDGSSARAQSPASPALSDKPATAAPAGSAQSNTVDAIQKAPPDKVQSPNAGATPPSSAVPTPQIEQQKQ